MLLHTVATLKKLGNPSQGLLLREHRIEAGRRVVSHLTKHHFFLAAIAADSPARQKLMCTLACAAYLSCSWCLFQGIRASGDVDKDGNATGAFQYKCGYVVPVPQTILFTGVPMLMDDARVQLTDEQMRARAERVRDGADPKDEGCNGLSVFAEALPYVSYNNLFQVTNT